MSDKQIRDLLERAKTETVKEQEAKVTEYLKDLLQELSAARNILARLEAGFAALLDRSVSDVADELGRGPVRHPLQTYSRSN